MIRTPPRSTLTYTLFPYATLFRSFFRPAIEAVAGLNLDAAVAQAREPFLGLAGERPADLDAINFFGEPREDRGVVPAIRSGLEDDVVLFDPGELRHQGHQRWLSDVLPDGDRPRDGAIGEGL